MAKRKLSVGYKVLVILSLATGICLNVINTLSVPAILSYYTLQSNIICLVAFICFVVFEIKRKQYKNDTYYLVKGAIIIAILITAIIYHFALMPVGFEMDSLKRSVESKAFANLLVHTVSPLLVTLDYFLFDEKGKFKSYYPVMWLIIPLNYVLYVYIYSFEGGTFFNIGGSKKFAYFFLDYEKMGYLGVAKWIVFMAVCILALSYILIVIDRKMRDKIEPS